MNVKAALRTLLLISILSGCASYPQNPAEQATYHAREARSAASQGDGLKAAKQIDDALNRPTGNEKIKELFASEPKAKDYYQTYLGNLIEDIATVSQAEAIYRKLAMVESSGILPDDQMRILNAKLSSVVVNGNSTGALHFALGNNLDFFPVLQAKDQKEIIVKRSVSILQGKDFGMRSVPALMKYVKQIGLNTAEAKNIESLLPTMKIRKDELNAVSEVYPAFAQERKASLSTRVYVQFKNSDRLFADDFLDLLRRKVRGVEWVTSAAPKVTTLVIERVRNDEKTFPERSRTITYAQHEVNLVSAALLMPRNASYLYDIVSSGAQIEYGYVISASLDGGATYEKVIRGKVGGESKRCQNARIQNVFGGITPADFVANDDMKRRCESEEVDSIDELRKQVLSRVTDGVLMVPQIKAVHELN